MKETIEILKALANKRMELSLIEIGKNDKAYSDAMKNVMESCKAYESLKLDEEVKKIMEKLLQDRDTVEMEQASLAYLVPNIMRRHFMKQYFYPAIFHTAEEGGFWVSFPDLPECLTEGDTMADAYEMAIEALGLSLTDRIHNHEKLPVPSTPDQVVLDTSDSHLVVIQFDMEAYQKKHNSKAVKKTLSIPEWLNEEAVTLGINFSQVLQEALIAKIQSH